MTIWDTYFHYKNSISFIINFDFLQKNVKPLLLPILSVFMFLYCHCVDINQLKENSLISLSTHEKLLGFVH